jgi:glyoxalase family protein
VSIYTRGFYNTTLTLRNIKETAEILTDIMGYRLQSGKNRYRFVTDAVPTANRIDLLEEPAGKTDAIRQGPIIILHSGSG